MAFDNEPGFGPPAGRSMACAADSHQDCGHLSGAIRRRVSRRLESAISLCRCPCHAACPLAARAPVPLTIWQQLCTCPGAARQRAWKEDADEPWPGAREQRDRDQREWQERRDARKEAFRAVRAAARGKTRSEIRDLYIAELRARGLDISPEPFLDAEIDVLTGNLLRGFKKFWTAGPGSFTRS
jgi:hypothetical protein